MNTLSEVEGPGAAQAASREARRRVRTSQGIYMLGVGVILTALGGGWLLAGPRADLLEGIFLMIAGGASLILPLVVRRWRARNGVYVVPKGELVRDDEGRERIPIKVKLAFGAGLVLTLGTVLYLTQMDPAAISDRLITGGVLSLSGLGFLGSFARFRLWEELLMGAGCLAAGLLAALGAAWGWPMLAIGAAALLTGFSYQRRWSRWVRSLEQA